MKRALPLLFLVFLAACVAETVERKRPRKGPIEAVGFVDLGGGNIRYSTEGWGWFVAGRRRDALRKMRKNCGKKLSAQVVDEYKRDDADISYAGEDVTTNLARGLDHYRYAPFQHMIYECRPKGGPAEPISISTGTPKVILVVPAVEESTTTVTSPAPEISTATVVSPETSTTTISPEPK